MVLFVVVYFVRRGKSFTPGVGNFQTLTQYVGFSLLGAGWFSSLGVLVKHREYHAESSFLEGRVDSFFFLSGGVDLVHFLSSVVLEVWSPLWGKALVFSSGVFKVCLFLDGVF
jgi:hypothetical protein